MDPLRTPPAGRAGAPAQRTSSPGSPAPGAGPSITTPSAGASAPPALPGPEVDTAGAEAALPPLIPLAGVPGPLPWLASCEDMTAAMGDAVEQCGEARARREALPPVRPAAILVPRAQRLEVAPGVPRVPPIPSTFIVEAAEAVLFPDDRLPERQLSCEDVVRGYALPGRIPPINDDDAPAWSAMFLLLDAAKPLLDEVLVGNPPSRAGYAVLLVGLTQLANGTAFVAEHGIDPEANSDTMTFSIVKESVMTMHGALRDRVAAQPATFQFVDADIEAAAHAAGGSAQLLRALGLGEQGEAALHASLVSGACALRALNRLHNALDAKCQQRVEYLRLGVVELRAARASCADGVLPDNFTLANSGFLRVDPDKRLSFGLEMAASLLARANGGYMAGYDIRDSLVTYQWIDPAVDLRGEAFSQVFNTQTRRCQNPVRDHERNRGGQMASVLKQYTMNYAGRTWLTVLESDASVHGEVRFGSSLEPPAGRVAAYRAAQSDWPQRPEHMTGVMLAIWSFYDRVPGAPVGQEQDIHAIVARLRDMFPREFGFGVMREEDIIDKIHRFLTSSRGLECRVTHTVRAGRPASVGISRLTGRDTGGQARSANH